VWVKVYSAKYKKSQKFHKKDRNYMLNITLNISMYWIISQVELSGMDTSHLASETEIDIADISQRSPPKMSAYVRTERWTLNLCLRHTENKVTCGNSRTEQANWMKIKRSYGGKQTTRKKQTCTCLNPAFIWRINISIGHCQTCE
jgi:hypothetical protein